MKIVIDIPEKVYGLLRYFEEGLGLTDKRNSNDDVKTALMRAVIHGTPLPKGHGRLIDADELKKNNEEYIIQYPTDREEDMQNKMVEWINEDITNAPTIIEGSEANDE